MAILLVAEHSNTALGGATAKALTAAKSIGGDVHVLVAGQDCKAAAEAAAKLGGVAKVLVADAPQFAHALLDVGKVMPGQLVDVAARQGGIVGEREQTANLLEAEPEFAPARDESQPIHLLQPVIAVATRSPRRVRQETHALVIPDCSDVAATGRRCFADLHALTL